ncbi:LytR family transcriptional regulator [Paenibacillus campinasensis]|uniref:LytR family transcriptional regulator n=1 Tax=Paenibacillus campinasensis TaxID=66347 RepID=A0ABW9T7N2_9BACL|nr:LCP family protein [Paenibacillus campinasensis]MUG68411.1 LytR family transcriptional regulator [Paenibacillus campinasensis]
MKRKTIYITLAVLLVAGATAWMFRTQLAVMAFDLFMAEEVENSLQRSYKPLEGSQAPDPVMLQSKPFSVMLLGSDQRENEPARSDTMIYAVVRPKESKVLLISVPRDTYTDIIGRGSKDKITHAFAFGGHQMAKDTMEAFLDQRIDYYASINFQGLKDVVDAMGGVALPIGKDIVNKGRDHEKFTIEANKPIYNGEEALNYVRYREDSDFNRAKRQQVFLDVAAKRLRQPDQIGKVPELIEIMGDNFQTDMQPKFIIDLAKQMLNGGKVDMTSFTIMGDGMRIGGIYYNDPDLEDVREARALIDNWMNPDTKAEQLLKPRDADVQI